MFSNIKSLLPFCLHNFHPIDTMQFASFPKIENLNSKIENFAAGRIILNNFYF